VLKEKLKDMEKAELEAWPKKSKPKIKYLLVNGSLKWGVSTATLFIIGSIFILDKSYDFEEVLFTFLAFIIGGFFFALVSYEVDSWYFKKVRSKVKKHDED